MRKSLSRLMVLSSGAALLSGGTLYPVKMCAGRRTTLDSRLRASLWEPITWAWQRNTEQARQEAAKCLELLEGKQLGYPIYYDVECEETQGSLTKEQLTEIVKTFCETVEAAGYYVGFYTMLSWAQNKLDYPELAQRFTSWIAWLDGDPSAKLTPAPDAWQYTWTGKFDGIDVDVDRDYFYKDFPSIIKGAGLNGYGDMDKPTPEPEKNTITLAELSELLRSQGITQIDL